MGVKGRPDADMTTGTRYLHSDDFRFFPSFASFASFAVRIVLRVLAVRRAAVSGRFGALVHAAIA